MYRLATAFCAAAFLSLFCGWDGINREPQATPHLSGGGAQQIDLREGISHPSDETDQRGNAPMKIQIQAGETVIIYELNNSAAARELYAQLPLITGVENFSTNEKIFYPPRELSADDAPPADAQRGTLAYYAPWGNVAMFYEDSSGGNGLYALGRAVSGGEDVGSLTGTIEITAVDLNEERSECIKWRTAG